ncbi:SDR family oxidoreductase [Croceicoccus sp. F390]|uniref:SDR family oxidoreductase n=1 Tax=Croceicoccus esteveae TaxID=3075597 RepID=A0ABU2ZLM3_9SPHN|nr:SDR family oxidoreductase [Croceicoccus sp. F390]MDT0577131.1 SDR family oxidoreductase [Croceicoccus sp. F390]
MDLGLAGKTVVITGGSGGIGHGLVMEFAREGANVVSASRDVDTGEKLAQRAKSDGLAGSILPVATDVTDRASVDAMLDIAHERFGLVDVLVNNAGGVGKTCPFDELDEETRRWEIALNIDGVVNCTQAVAKDMLSRGTGSVINISSNSSLLGEAAQNIVHYGAVKGFVNSFSKLLAYEWGPKGVRVNNIAPGWIVPHKNEEIAAGSFWNRLEMGTPEGMQQALEDGSLFNMSSLPIKRLGRPEDMAYLTMFLASDLSSYITGQLISVSGGVYMP